MELKIIDKRTGKELKGCIIVISEHGGYDVYKSIEDLINEDCTVTKYSEFYGIHMIYD